MTGKKVALAVELTMPIWEQFTTDQNDNITKTCPCIINRDFLALKIEFFSAEFVLSFSYFCSKHRFKGVCISRTYFPDGLVPGRHLLSKCENSIVRFRLNTT